MKTKDYMEKLFYPKSIAYIGATKKRIWNIMGVIERGYKGDIYLVSEKEHSVWANAPEMQVLDDKKHRDGGHQRTSAGSLYDLIAPRNKKLNPVGEFNKSRIIKKGNHVEHWLNGSKILEYKLDGKRLQILLKESKFRDMQEFAKRDVGFIALQHHGEEVWYRNIRIKKIH